MTRRRKRAALGSPVAAHAPPPLSADDLHRLLRAPLSAVAAARVAAGLWSRFGGVAPPLRCSVLLFALSFANGDARPHRSTRLNAHAWTGPGLADAWNAHVDSSPPRGEGGGDDEGAVCRGRDAVISSNVASRFLHDAVACGLFLAVRSYGMPGNPKLCFPNPELPPPPATADELDEGAPGCGGAAAAQRRGGGLAAAPASARDARFDDSMTLSSRGRVSSSDDDASGGRGSERGRDGRGGGVSSSDCDASGDADDAAMEDAGCGDGTAVEKEEEEEEEEGMAAASHEEARAPRSGAAAPRLSRLPGHCTLGALLVSIPALWALPSGALRPLLSSGRRSFARSDVEDALRLPTPRSRATSDAVHRALRRLVALGLLARSASRGKHRYAPAVDGGGSDAAAAAEKEEEKEEEEEEEGGEGEAAARGSDTRAVPSALALRQYILQLCALPRGALAMLAASHRLRSYCQSDVERALGLPRARSNATRCAVRDALSALVRSQQLAFVGLAVDADSWRKSKRYALPHAAAAAAAAIAAAGADPKNVEHADAAAAGKEGADAGAHEQGGGGVAPSQATLVAAIPRLWASSPPPAVRRDTTARGAAAAVSATAAATAARRPPPRTRSAVAARVDALLLPGGALCGVTRDSGRSFCQSDVESHVARAAKEASSPVEGGDVRAVVNARLRELVGCGALCRWSATQQGATKWVYHFAVADAACMAAAAAAPATAAAAAATGLPPTTRRADTAARAAGQPRAEAEAAGSAEAEEEEAAMPPPPKRGDTAAAGTEAAPRCHPPPLMRTAVAARVDALLLPGGALCGVTRASGRGFCQSDIESRLSRAAGCSIGPCEVNYVNARLLELVGCGALHRWSAKHEGRRMYRFEIADAARMAAAAAARSAAAAAAAAAPPPTTTKRADTAARVAALVSPPSGALYLHSIRCDSFVRSDAEKFCGDSRTDVHLALRALVE